MEYNLLCIAINAIHNNEKKDFLVIDLKDAATFLRLCETENLTRTASLCGVSPSTLSRTLNKLESTLQTNLCIRDKKGVSITPYGRKFEKFARNCLNEYAALEQELHHGAESISGKLKIYCSVTASYLFIPRILNEIHLSAPHLEVKLETGDPADALDKLEDPQIDLVISALPQDIPSNIKFLDLINLPLVLLAPKQPRFQFNFSTDLKNSDLSKVHFIIPEKGQLRYEVEKWFSAMDIHPEIYAEIAGHEAIVSMAGLGFGLAIVPRLVYEISPFKNDVNVLRELQWSNFRVALCSKKINAQDKKIQFIYDLVSRLAPSFTPDLTRRRNENII